MSQFPADYESYLKNLPIPRRVSVPDLDAAQIATVTESVFTPNAPAYEGVTVSRDNWPAQAISRGRVYGEYLRIRAYATRGDIAGPVPSDLNS